MDGILRFGDIVADPSLAQLKMTAKQLQDHHDALIAVRQKLGQCVVHAQGLVDYLNAALKNGIISTF